jgi:hypothetical protein
MHRLGWAQVLPKLLLKFERFVRKFGCGKMAPRKALRIKAWRGVPLQAPVSAAFPALLR